jgi:hypothetical protein
MVAAGIEGDDIRKQPSCVQDVVGRILTTTIDAVVF